MLRFSLAELLSWTAFLALLCGAMTAILPFNMLGPVVGAVVMGVVLAWFGGTLLAVKLWGRICGALYSVSVTAVLISLPVTVSFIDRGAIPPLSELFSILFLLGVAAITFGLPVLAVVLVIDAAIEWVAARNHLGHRHDKRSHAPLGE